MPACVKRVERGAIAHEDHRVGEFHRRFVIKVLGRQIPVRIGNAVSLGRFVQQGRRSYRIGQDVDGDPTVKVVLPAEVGEHPKVSDEDVGRGIDRRVRMVPIVDGPALGENPVEPFGNPPGRAARARGTSVGAEVVRPVGEA